MTPEEMKERFFEAVRKSTEEGWDNDTYGWTEDDGTDFLGYEGSVDALFQAVLPVINNFAFDEYKRGFIDGANKLQQLPEPLTKRLTRPALLKNDLIQQIQEGSSDFLGSVESAIRGAKQ